MAHMPEEEDEDGSRRVITCLFGPLPLADNVVPDQECPHAVTS
jgi:hypothetical protein